MKEAGFWPAFFIDAAVEEDRWSRPRARCASGAAAVRRHCPTSPHAIVRLASCRHQFVEARAGAVDAAFHGADGTAGDVGGILVGEAFGADQDERLALIRRQLRQRLAEIDKIEVTLLLGRDRKLGGQLALAVGDLALRLAQLREVGIAKNGEQPSLEIGPCLERVRDGSTPSPALPARDRRRGRGCRTARWRTPACSGWPRPDRRAGCCLARDLTYRSPHRRISWSPALPGWAVSSFLMRSAIASGTGALRSSPYAARSCLPRMSGSTC